MKNVLCTGAAGGIGSAVSERLLRDGCRVARLWHKKRPLPPPAGTEERVFDLSADLTRSAEATEAVETVLRRFCQVDILICCAGLAHTGLFQDLSDEDYRQVTAVNLDSAVYCARAVLPSMIHRKAGRIVFCSSMWGQTGGSCEAAYSAAKAGLIGLTKALAKETAPSGITVNCLAPGVVDTPMLQNLTAEEKEELAAETPLGRLGSPDDIAGVASFLCSPDAAFLTGQVIAVNGGFVI